VAGLAVLTAVLVALLCLRRRKRSKHWESREKLDLDPEPQLPAPNPFYVDEESNVASTRRPSMPDNPSAIALVPMPGMGYSTKARMRADELQGQLNSARAALAFAHEQGAPDSSSSSGGRPSLYPPSLTDTPATSSAHEIALQGRVNALEDEVRRLRVVNEEFPPPAYEGDPSTPLLSPGHS
jgi:hypothetical protein